MKRDQMVNDLIKEGLSEKTLSNFSDKQIKALHTRMVSEVVQKVMKTYDTKNPGDIKALNAALHDPKTDHSTIDVKEDLKGDQEKIDANDNGKIDSDDFEILRGEKEEQKEGQMDEEADGSMNELLHMLWALAPIVGIHTYQSLKNWWKENKDTPEAQELLAKVKSKADMLSPEAHGHGDVETEKLEEGKKPKKWIQKAIHPSKKGSLKKALGVKKGEKIPAEKLKAAAKKGGKLGQRARFAMNVKNLKEDAENGKNEVKDWVSGLVNEKYHPSTTKGEILSMINEKLTKK